MSASRGSRRLPNQSILRDVEHGFAQKLPTKTGRSVCLLQRIATLEAQNQQLMRENTQLSVHHGVLKSPLNGWSVCCSPASVKSFPMRPCRRWSKSPMVGICPQCGTLKCFSEPCGNGRWTDFDSQTLFKPPHVTKFSSTNNRSSRSSNRTRWPLGRIAPVKVGKRCDPKLRYVIS